MGYFSCVYLIFQLMLIGTLAVVPEDPINKEGNDVEFSFVPLGSCIYDGIVLSPEECKEFCLADFWTDGNCQEESCRCQGPRRCDYHAMSVDDEMCDYLCRGDGWRRGKCENQSCRCEPPKNTTRTENP